MKVSFGRINSFQNWIFRDQDSEIVIGTLRCMALQRFVFNPNAEELGVPKFMLMFAARKVKKNSKGHGYGLHSKEEGKYFPNSFYECDLFARGECMQLFFY